jgi:phage repressor protein C with HTH and peptisase S24 domain
VTSQSLLTDLAQGQLNAVQNPPVSLKIVYAPYQDPILGSYNLGDDVRVRINDDRAGQTDDYYRVVAIPVSPGENNQGERAILTLTQKGAV